MRVISALVLATAAISCVHFGVCAVPATLYIGSSSLAYLAAGNLPAPVLQALYQSKIVISAVLSVLLLGKTISLSQMALLAVVAAGVAVVHTSFHAPHDEAGAPPLNVLGMSHGLLSVLLSASAGVVSEGLLKPRRPSGKGGLPPPARSGNVWLFNAQLASISTCVSAVRLLVESQQGGGLAPGASPLQWSGMVWLHLLVAASGGLLAGLAVKVCDSMTKGVATSCSMVLTAGASVLGLGVPMHWWGVLGLLATPAASAAYMGMGSSKPTGKGGPGHLVCSGSGGSLGASSPSALASRGARLRRRQTTMPT